MLPAASGVTLSEAQLLAVQTLVFAIKGILADSDPLVHREVLRQVRKWPFPKEAKSAFSALGGRRRAESLSPERRSEIGKSGFRARFGGRGHKPIQEPAA